MAKRGSAPPRQVWVSVRCAVCWTQSIAALDGVTAHLPPVVLSTCPSCQARTRAFVLASVVPLVPRAKVAELQRRVKRGEGLTYTQQELPLLDLGNPAEE